MLIRANPQRRSAVTLFELMLTMVVLVVILAFSWPAIDGLFDTSRMRAAGDHMRAVFTDARLEAMRSGSPRLFRYEIDSPRYSVAVWNWNSVDETEGSETESSASSASEDELPEGITFHSGEVLQDARATYTATADASASVSSSQPPIIFYPDGTTTDAAIILKNEQDIVLRVTLRGLTGLARASETMTLRELREQEP